MGDKEPPSLQGRQLGDALERAAQHGVIPLERGRKAQKPRRSGHKNNGREDKAQNNNLKEDPMTTQAQQTQTQQTNNAPVISPEVKDLKLEQSMSVIANTMAFAIGNGKPVPVAVATMTPLKRTALESAVKFGIAGAIATGVVVGLHYTIGQSYRAQ